MLNHEPKLDINLKSNEGGTALYYAAGENHPKVVDLLLKHGAEKSYTDDPHDMGT